MPPVYPAALPGSHLVYDVHMLFDLLGSNGFTGHGLDTGAAIVRAESHGNTKARHVNADGSIDRGIWQINSRAHPEVSDACAYDPRCATRAAARISKGGTDFSPWSTYKNGAYKNFLGSAAGASGLQNQGLPDDISGITNPVKDVASVIEKFFDLLTSLEFWLRVGEGIAGLVLLGMGFKALTGITIPTPIGKL